MSVTVTSLVHPTMIKKIREGLKYAALNQGHKMNGHNNRVYIANAKGHNILRIDWKGSGKFIAYGRESKDVTEMVKKALRMANVKPVHTYSPSLQERLGKLTTLAGMGIALTACSNHGGVTSIATIISSIFT